jgi:hypothetical protein
LARFFGSAVASSASSSFCPSKLRQRAATATTRSGVKSLNVDTDPSAGMAQPKLRSDERMISADSLMIML